MSMGLCMQTDRTSWRNLMAELSQVSFYYICQNESHVKHLPVSLTLPALLLTHELNVHMMC